MSIYRSAYNAILSLKRFAKKDGGTDEDINDAIDYATNFFKKTRLPEDTKQIILKVLEDSKSDKDK